ncbi:ABC transporter substrate-binding protein [Acrocarpospora pleiomorpha]|uniref:ABC transporter substrate-binding protein n=1 Tax=Acrocarpospora pleiomorpha TaxID=90975 RepID=UPI001478467C|nr:ABC transporter substrate-binding protein [Acrocarpospora pleiomorpha]
MIGSVMLALAGCASGSTGGSTDGASGPGDQILKILTATEPRSLNPVVDVGKGAGNIQRTVVEYLIATDESGVPNKEGLVTAWARSSPVTWELSVREGVEFSNGEKLDAEAVAQSITLTRDSEGILAAYLSGVDAKATADYKVEVTTEKSLGILPDILSIVPALPPKYYEQVGRDGFGTSPIGTGPFVFGSWTKGQSISVTRNDRYWGGAVGYKGVTLTWTPEASSQVSQLTTGAVDIVDNVDPTVAGQLNSADVTVKSRLGQRTMYLLMNVFEPPFNKVEARRAVVQAIDRGAITSLLADQGATPSLWPPNFGSSTSGGQNLTVSKDAAATDFQKAGVSSIPFIYTIGRYPQDSQMAEAIGAMLGDANVKVDLNGLEYNTFIKQVLGRGPAGLIMIGIAPLYPSEDAIAQTILKTNGVENYCADAELDKEVAAVREIDDREKRSARYSELQNEVLNDRVCVMPLFNFQDIVAVSNRVKGFEQRADQYIDVRKLTFT